MHPRLRLDIGWGDLAFAALAVALAHRRERCTRAVETGFAPDALATLSARSGFDLYLSALALPAGSEVLVSGLTIPHMSMILAAHGLRTVPFALDPQTLAPAPGELARRATPRTRAVLFAHLFGQRADLGELREHARHGGWLVWEDCAQAYAGDGWRGHPESDLVLFSFGLIKTATAVQGGIVRVPDAAVRARMRSAQADWPLQPRADFVRRMARAALLHALARPWAFARFARACARRGHDMDEVLHAATRGFPGPDFLARLRRAPSAPLLALLARRLAHPAASCAPARARTGETLLAALGPEAEVVGRPAPERQHWVFAVACDEPAQLVRALRAAKFDATARSSLVAVAPDDGGPAPAPSRRLLERLVYVPLAPEATEDERAALVGLLRAALADGALAPFRAQGREEVPSPPAGQPHVAAQRDARAGGRGSE
jgi:dTDP-4-amino-4,6-dideoxygalactose transaminase